MSFASKLALATALTGALAFAHPAMAGCKRMGFTVNDYGKEGPTRDAISLLDKHVATWAAEQGIEKYSVGKKDVSCELFLNMIVFDEHTCTASATVCWGPELQKQQDAKATKSTAPSKKEASAKAKTEEKAPATSESTAEAKPAEKPAETKSEQAAAAPAASSPVETGTIPVPPAAAATAEAAGAAPTAPVEPVKADVNATPAASTELDTAHKASAAAAEAAAAAAERAAAAAERAALAAERAAAAIADRPASVPAATPSPETTAPASESSASAPVSPVTPTP